MYKYIVGIIFFFIANRVSAQQIFVPLDNDFILYDLQKEMIVKRFQYSDNPFGVRPQLSSDGRYLYYTKRLFNNFIIYQRDLRTNEEMSFAMNEAFTYFKLMADSRILLDERETFVIPNVPRQQLSNAYMLPMNIDKERNELYLEEDFYFLPNDFQANIMQAYYLVREEQILFNAFYTYEKEPWKNYYQWYLLDGRTSQLHALPHLRGPLHFSQGGAFIGERVAISYINNEKQM